MAQIPPILDEYIDDVIKSSGDYVATKNKTQGIKLRELVKKLRDYFEQEIPKRTSDLINDSDFVVQDFLKELPEEGNSKRPFIIRPLVNFDPDQVFGTNGQPVHMMLIATEEVNGKIVPVQMKVTDGVTPFKDLKNLINDIDVSGKVDKTGDTMTGALVVNKGATGNTVTNGITLQSTGGGIQGSSIAPSLDFLGKSSNGQVQGIRLISNSIVPNTPNIRLDFTGDGSTWNSFVNFNKSNFSITNSLNYAAMLEITKLTQHRTYTLQDKSGVIALLDDIPAPIDISGKENISNKATTLANPNNVTYPTTQAVSNELANKATLDNAGKVPVSQLPDAILGALQFQSQWNASTNTPAIPTASAQNKGHFYITQTAGVYNSVNYNVGDWILSNGTDWEKISNSDAVTSVFGRIGSVVAVAGDYTSDQILNQSSISGNYITDALEQLNNAKADDVSVVHKTGDEYISGNKVFETIQVEAVKITNTIFQPGDGDPDDIYEQKLQRKNGTIALTSDIPSPVDISSKEDKSNKATNLTSPDDVKYPTTQAVSSALAAKADDANVVHKTDNETIAGIKTFSSQINSNNGIAGGNGAPSDKAYRLDKNGLFVEGSGDTGSATYGATEMHITGDSGGILIAQNAITMTGGDSVNISLNSNRIQASNIVPKTLLLPDIGGKLALTSDIPNVTDKASINGANAVGTWPISITGTSSNSNGLLGYPASMTPPDPAKVTSFMAVENDNENISIKGVGISVMKMILGIPETSNFAKLSENNVFTGVNAFKNNVQIEGSVRQYKSDAIIIDNNIGRSSSAGNSIQIGWDYNGGTPFGYVQMYEGLGDLILQRYGGKIGIGTTSPQQKFVVSHEGELGLEVYDDYLNNKFGIQTFNRSTGNYGELQLDSAQLTLRSTSGGFHVTSNASAIYIKLMPNGVLSSGLYADTSGFSGFTGDTGSWKFRVRNDGYAYATSFVAEDDWFRSRGNTGWFNETYDGGIYMEDNTYVRVYNSKGFLVDNDLVVQNGAQIRVNGKGFKSHSLHGLVGNYDQDGTTDKLIWTIGDNWNSISTVYGMGYTYNNISGFGHSIFFAEAGTKTIQFGLGSGAARFNGAITAASFYESSDKRLKSNVADLSLNNYDEVRAKSYIKNGQEQIGYIAQEVIDYLPSAVQQDENGYYNVNYTQVLVAKVYSLEQEIKFLKEKINGLD